MLMMFDASLSVASPSFTHFCAAVISFRRVSAWAASAASRAACSAASPSWLAA